MKYDKPQIIYDDWQKEFLKCETDKILCTGRQVGKSEICAVDCCEYAVKHSNENILIIAPTERQSYALFNRVLDYISNKYPKELITKGKDKPTMTRFVLTNKTKIYCLPTGLSGTGIRFMTINRLYIDEASRVPDEVISAVTPMLLTTGGKIILLSTPAGANGFFYKYWINENHAYDSFYRYSADSEQVIKNRHISSIWTEKRREMALNHLEREKKRMSQREYAQEYLGEFVQDLHRFFPDWLIAKCCVLARQDKIPDYKYYLGVDIARLGEDETTYEIICKIDNKTFKHSESIVKTKQLTTQTERDILMLDLIWKFRNIGIDAGSGSLGVGVFDHLLQTSIRQKVIPINNRQLALDPDGKKSQRLLKTDLYNNLLGMMEKGEILLLNDADVSASLASVQYEYVFNNFGITQLRIFGNYTHIAEGLIRAAWLAQKDKSLNLWASSISDV